MSGELPKGWATAQISDVTERVPNIKPEDSPDKEFGYVDISSIDNSSFVITDVKRFKGKDAPSRARRPIRPNDIVFSNVRTYLRNVALVDQHCGAEVCSTGFTVLRPNAAVEPRFLFRYVLTDQFLDRVTPQQTGTHYPATSDRVVISEQISLAPLPEQRRIVAKLETLLGKVDASQQRLAKIPVLLKRFRQSVLAAACSGRLTADWREENPADEIAEDLLSIVLTHRVNVWKRSGRKGSCPVAPMPDTPSLRDVPLGWAWIPLGILGANPFETVQTGPFGALLHKEEFTPSGVPVVAVGNLTGMGFTKEGLYFVPYAKALQLSRFDIQAGDVLFARSGATLGKVCVAPPDAKDWRMTGHILRARLNRDFLLPNFCVFALRGDPAVMRQVFGSVQGTTRPGYNTTLLESIALPLAPLPEQQEIVRRVEGLFALADQLELRLAKAHGQVDQLTPSLLVLAFAGKLVPQDPSDEPASVLLERINTHHPSKSRRDDRK